MSRHVILSLSEVDYQVVCKLINQNEIKREQSRMRQEQKTGIKSTQHVKPPILTVVANIDTLNNPQALIKLGEVTKMAPPKY